jgi:hypothetical protein
VAKSAFATAAQPPAEIPHVDLKAETLGDDPLSIDNPARSAPLINRKAAFRTF